MMPMRSSIDALFCAWISRSVPTQSHGAHPAQNDTGGGASNRAILAFIHHGSMISNDHETRGGWPTKKSERTTVAC